MRRMNISVLLLLVIIIRFYIPELSAQTYVTEERETLRGLRGCCVLIESLDKEIVRAGLTRSVLKTDVELRLRKAGITVLTEEQSLRTPGGPYLYVNINAIKIERTDLFVYDAEVEFIQNVILSRNRSIETGATTWDHSFTGITPNLRTIRESVRDSIDRFMNDYLAVNPK